LARVPNEVMVAKCFSFLVDACWRAVASCCEFCCEQSDNFSCVTFCAELSKITVGSAYYIFNKTVQQNKSNLKFIFY
jgi:hypothetical protein